MRGAALCNEEILISSKG